jgi:hypothetical protein
VFLIETFQLDGAGSYYLALAQKFSTDKTF